MASNSAASLVLGLVLTSVATTAVAGPAVLELYTSEGCSSCPPAEKLIEELSRRSDVLPLAFHVDYWDSLGWRDRFALPEGAQRQEQAARTMRLSTVGTPQMIVNGRTVIWGAARSAVEQALASARGGREIQVDRLGDVLTLRTERSAPSDALELYMIGYLPRAVTAIGRGENAGRTLTEVNIVRSIQRIGRSDSGGAWHVSLGGLPPDASCVAALLQEPNGAIVAAKPIARSAQPCTAAPKTEWYRPTKWSAFQERSFDALDKDKDGFLTRAEFTSPPKAELAFATAAYVRGLTNDEMFKKIDANGDGKISKDEFVGYQRKIFEMLDKGKKGMAGPTDFIRKAG